METQRDQAADQLLLLDFFAKANFHFAVFRRTNASKHLCLILFGFSLLVPVAFGQTQSNQPTVLVVAVEGSGEVLQNGSAQPSPLVAGMAVTSPATIRTMPNSRVTIMVGTSTVVRGGADAEFEFVSESEGKVSTKLNHGRLYFLHRDKSGRFSVETPAATANVVGTDFSIVVAMNATTTIDLFDGEVEFANAQGAMPLKGRSTAMAEVGKPPQRTAVIEMSRAVQWNLYYPAIVDVDELALGSNTRTAIGKSLDAYRSGDLLEALAVYPKDRQPVNRAERLYFAGLLLAVGQVNEAREFMQDSTGEAHSQADARLDSIERGLRRVIATVLGEQLSGQASSPTNTASEWLAISYERQGLTNLAAALDAAQSASRLDTNFSFALARVADLEFSFGRTPGARRSLDVALSLSPKNAQAIALKGFILAARNNFAEAAVEFDRATRLDPSLANGWLGRGLCRIHSGDIRDGLEDLQVAAATEPARAVLRSYLAKAYVTEQNTKNAEKEFGLAKTLDPGDPTSWLYSALFLRDEHRFNEGITNLERSIELNENRSVYRSRMRLDEDLAVRGANLAALYQNVGMFDVSVNQASRAVAEDYANYSAHLFLANSYNQLRDPSLVNLRFETATFSEYLMANLLSPVGGTPLSPRVSQQEYSRFFERNRIGVSSETTYLSHGDWQQSGSIYGSYNNTGFAFDSSYLSQNGNAANTDLEQKAFSIQLKQQLSAQDSVYAQATFSDYDSGDIRQYYNPDDASPSLHTEECQSPNLFVGYHHEWSPGNHTLFLGARLDDRFSLTDQNVIIPGVILGPAGEVVGTVDQIGQSFGITNADAFQALNYLSKFEAYSAELQQIVQLPDHTLVCGARYQTGQTRTSSDESRAAGAFPPYGGGFDAFDFSQKNTANLNRFSVYGYDQWQALDSLWLTAGLSYDYLKSPWNVDNPPISDDDRTTCQLSPKAGFVWSPATATTVRGAFTRSLGGVFYDSSVRLEPAQIAGFNQAYRSLIPESLVGNIPGTSFQTFDLAFEQRFKSRTYLTVQGELLTSNGSRDIGAFNFDPNGINPTVPYQIRQDLDFTEESLAVGLNQLIGKEWSLGARYRLAHAHLDLDYPDVSDTVMPGTDNSALLQTVNLFAIYNHPSGFFAEAQGLWFGQNNYDYSPGLTDDCFWQCNLFAGYRLPRGRAEFTIGLLNLTDQDYHLNPLNAHQELPRDRTLMVNLKFNF
jgi:tetratricopeptide (TPR) repeat protein